MENTQKTSTGLDANVAAALTYAIGWVTGLAFLVMEKDNRFVRFHAMQSTIVFATLSLGFILLQSIPLLGHAALGIHRHSVVCAALAPDDVQGVPGRTLQAADCGGDG